MSRRKNSIEFILEVKAIKFVMNGVNIVIVVSDMSGSFRNSLNSGF